MTSSLRASAAFYAFYFIAVGFLLPTFPVHLYSLNITATEVGWLMASTPFAVTFTPMLWGYFADRLSARVLLLRLASAGAAAAMLMFVFADGFWTAMIVMLIYALLVAPISSLVDAITLARIRQSGGDYGRVRLWGSLGFVAGSLGAAGFTQLYGYPGTTGVVIASSFLFIASLSTFFLEAAPGVTSAPSVRDAVSLLRTPGLLLFLLLTSLHWLTLSPYHTFFSVFAFGLELPGFVTGAAMAVGALSETVVMRLFGGVEGRLSSRAWLLLSFCVTFVRWVATATLDHPALLVSVQVLHAFSFGTFYMAAMRSLVELVPDELRATGQGLFVACTFGLGGGLGSLLSGWSYEQLGGHAMFAGAAGVSALTIVLALTFVSTPKPTDRDIRVAA